VIVGPAGGRQSLGARSTKENWQFPHIFFRLSYDTNRLVLIGFARTRPEHSDRLWKGAGVLLPLGSPLPDDTVSAVRGESGVLGGLSVPLKWGVVVPPDDYDHWAPKPEVSVETPEEMADVPRPTAVADGVWTGWDGDTVPRAPGVIPHSPAAG